MCVLRYSVGDCEMCGTRSSMSLSKTFNDNDDDCDDSDGGGDDDGYDGDDSGGGGDKDDADEDDDDDGDDTTRVFEIRKQTKQKLVKRETHTGY